MNLSFDSNPQVATAPNIFPYHQHKAQPNECLASVHNDIGHRNHNREMKIHMSKIGTANLPYEASEVRGQECQAH